MFYMSRDYHDIAGVQGTGRVSFLLIPSFTGYANENLAAALVGVMNMPVVATTRFKRDVGKEPADSPGFVSGFK